MAEVKIEYTGDATKQVNGVQALGSAFDKLKTVVWDMGKQFLAIYGSVAVVSRLTSAVGSAVPETQKLASETLKLQRTTGMTAEAASTLIAVADDVGVSFGALQTAVTQVSRRMGGLKDIESAVMDSSGQMTDVFEKFHIQVKNSDGSLKTFGDVFEQIRSRIKGASSETERMAIATQFFRGNSTELMPLLTMSAQQWQRMADDAKRYGLVLSQENVMSVREYTMAQRDLDDAFQGIKLTIGNAVIPALSEMIRAATNAVATVKDFTAQHQALLALPFDILKTVKRDIAELVTPTAIGLVVLYKEQLMALAATHVGVASLTTSVSALSTNITLLGIAAAAAAGYGIGKLVDSLAYKIGNIDITGMNRIGEEIEAANARQARGAKALSSAVAELHLEGVRTWKDFENLEKQGLIRYDRITGKWVDIRKETQLSEAQIKATTKALTEMSDVVSKMGQVQLKFAEEQFVKDLETPLLKAGEATKDDRTELQRLQDAYETYGATVQDVFTTQLSLQDKIKSALLAGKASIYDVAKQMLATKETEVKSVAERLTVQQRYYEELKTRQKTAYDAMTAAQEKYNATVKAGNETQKELQNTLAEIEEKMQPEKTPLEAYEAKTTKLKEQYSAIMSAMPAGEGRINALKELARQWPTTIGAITQTMTSSVDTAVNDVNASWRTVFDSAPAKASAQETSQVLKSQVETARVAYAELGIIMATVAQDQQAVNESMRITAEAQATQFNALTDAVHQAGQAINVTKTELQGLDALLSQQRVLTIDVSGALAAVYSVINAIQGVNVGGGSVGAITGSLSPVSGASPSFEPTGFPSLIPASEAGFASGTSYVPRTGFYQLHRGETVLNPNETARRASAAPQVTINIPAINVTPQDGDDPATAAKKTVKYMAVELKRLGFLS